MKITLYKNCILNKQYYEVIRTRQVLEEYLSNLERKTVIIDDTYIKLNGELILEFSNNERINNLVVFDYNYIRLENNNDNDNTIIYAFIDRVDFYNECVRIFYTMDVWSTMIDKWSVRKAYVTQSLRTITGEPREKLLPFINNGKKLVDNIENNTHHFAIIVKMQIYSMTNTDFAGFEYEGYGLYCVKDNEIYDYEIGTNISDILDKIVYATTKQEWRSKNQTLFSGAKYCSIPEMYVIPWYYINAVFERFDTSKCVSYAPTDELLFLEFPTIPNIKVYERSIIASDLMTSVGLFTQQVPYVYNGLPAIYEIYMHCDRDSFRLYFSLYDNLMDITKGFLSIQDYTVVTPETIAQREIARSQQIWSGIFGITNSAIQMGVGAATVGAGAAVSAASETAVGAARGGAITAQGAGGISGGLTGLIGSIVNIVHANKEKYMGFNAINNDTEYYINAYYGICSLYKNNVINAEESQKVTEECGYKVDYIVNNIDINDEQTDYNVIKCEMIKLKGVTTEINEIITRILSNGVKIWYVVPS